MEKIKLETRIDSRIPQTLEEARKLSGIRFHDWDEASREMVQKIMLIEGDHAQLISGGTIYPSHPLHDEVRVMTDNDGRWASAIVTIAAKLNNVYDY